MVVFYDPTSVSIHDIHEVLRRSFVGVKWPSSIGVNTIAYSTRLGEPETKWNNPQRYMMLSGFVHVPGRYVETEYWLKLDTDTIASGQPDWIDENWFNVHVEGEPRANIVSHPWGYTKPPNQMLELDKWKEEHELFKNKLTLDLRPSTPQSSMVKHKRIISWCSFFHTQ
jgi:hypothetical protein